MLFKGLCSLRLNITRFTEQHAITVVVVTVCWSYAQEALQPSYTGFHNKGVTGQRYSLSQVLGPLALACLLDRKSLNAKYYEPCLMISTSGRLWSIQTVSLLTIPEIPIEILDESYISRLSPRVLNTMLSRWSRNRDPGISIWNTNILTTKMAVLLCP